MYMYYPRFHYSKISMDDLNETIIHKCLGLILTNDIDAIIGLRPIWRRFNPIVRKGLDPTSVNSIEMIQFDR